MAFDISTAVGMVRNLAGVANPSDATIQSVLIQHAVPRIKMYLLAATDTAGAQIFYDRISDLADAATAQAAEALVDLVFDEPIISEGLRRVAAAFAASWLILNAVGIIESQQKIAYSLEKMAQQDLDRLVKGQVVTRAVESAFPKLPSVLGGDTVYMALDFDPLSVDAEMGSAKAYAGAQEDGRITAIINGYAVQADVLIGDTPIVVLDKLSRQLAAAQAADLVNVSAAPAEGFESAGVRKHTYLDGVGAEQTVDVTYTTHLSQIAFKPFKLDNVVDAAVITVYLSHRDPDNPGQYLPGLKGLLYGAIQNVQRMSKLGPYSAIVDLHTGKSASLSTETSGDQSKLISDSLFFEVVPGGIPEDGEIRYRINDSATQVIAVTAGADAQGVVNAIASDLAAKAPTQRVLGAVRPASQITLNGTPKTAPGLELVAYLASSTLAKMVFHLESVPDGVSFGVVPSTLITQGNWDNQAKSVVIESPLRSARSMSDEPISSATPKGEVFNATHKNSSKLQNILDRIKLAREGRY